MSAELLKQKIDALRLNIRIEEENYQCSLEQRMDVLRLMELRMKLGKLKSDLEVLLGTLRGIK
jgi:hypothetical protein